MILISFINITVHAILTMKWEKEFNPCTPRKKKSKAKLKLRPDKVSFEVSKAFQMFGMNSKYPVSFPSFN